MLWIALLLPALSLEVFLRANPSTEAAATVDARHVLAVNAAAAARGVRPGMAIAAAYALAPELTAKRREPRRETEGLQAAATWASQFTPNVVLETGADPAASGLLLEVSGSLALFGGFAPILDGLRTGMDALGFSAVCASAPTARGAQWLARAFGVMETHLTTQTALDQALGELPIGVLDCGVKTLAMLDAIGARTLADVRALPRAGFARRFGAALLDRLDEASGRRALAHAFYIPPERFFAKLELPAHVHEAAALLFAFRRLFVELEGFLRARAAGTQRLDLIMWHEDHPETHVALGLVGPAASAAHFTTLARERLGRLRLPGPAHTIGLGTSEVVPLTGANRTLFAEMLSDAARSEDWARLVERLRARLGPHAVHGLAAAAEHRPDYATQPVRLDATGMGTARSTAPAAPLSAGARPFWLLREPQPLHELNGQPRCDGPLTLLAGPERIESGWWDGIDITRDYFVATRADHSLVWIYRERRPAGQWFLHGLFA